MDSYLLAYRELSKFFQDLGTVFGFINSDVASKLAIMEEYRANQEVCAHYAKLRVMMAYERKSGAIENQRKPSGSRTLLRLHRALEFIAALFQNLSSANDDTKMGGLAQECYERTLAKHHPWLIRKGAVLALYSLPTCKQIFEKAHTSEKAQLRPLMMAVAEDAQRVYNFAQGVYEENNMLDLP